MVGASRLERWPNKGIPHLLQIPWSSRKEVKKKRVVEEKGQRDTLNYQLVVLSLGNDKTAHGFLNVFDCIRAIANDTRRKTWMADS
jgi:hypothetical protein